MDKNKFYKIEKLIIKTNKPLVISTLQWKRTNYLNAISYKLNNKRITVIKEENGFAFEFRIIDKDHKSHATCEYRNDVAFIRIILSKEATELVLLSLAEQINIRIY